MRKMSDLIRNQNPLVLLPHVTVREAAEHMRDRRVGAVLVVDETACLIGIFTGRDAVCRVLAAGRNPADVTLGEVMTGNPSTVHTSRSAIEALRLMQDAHYRHLPIVDDGKVVGIVSRGDFSGIELDRLYEETGLWERIA